MVSRVWLWIRQDTTSTDWLIVLLTAVIAGTSYLQWHEIKSGGRDTHELALAAGKQADKMKDMSDAAEKIRQAAEGMVTQEQRIADNAQKSLNASSKQNKAGLDASIGASRLDQRAWVASVGMGMDPPEVGKKGHGFVTWNNSGKTFARRVKPLCHWAFVPKEILSEVELTKLVPPVDTTSSIGVLAPNAQYKTIIEGREPINASLQTELLSSWYTYLWGEITYEDIFKRSHTTVFCSVRPGTTGDFTQCPFHNDAN
jgi:hypothetical protein